MDKEELQKLIEEGLSFSAIGKRVGRSQSNIRFWAAKFELKTKRVPKCKCGETDPVKFTKGRYTECRRCRGRYQTGKYRNYKGEAIAYKGGKCELCGYDKCQAALDFHHRDMKQKDPKWRNMRAWTFEKIKAELDKCQLVCCRCHREIHYMVK